MGIEREIKTILDFEKKLWSAKDIAKALADIAHELIQNYPEDQLPEIRLEKGYIIEDTTFWLEDSLVRSKMILIFCYMEVLFSINIAYEECISDLETITTKLKQNFNAQVQYFLLSRKNALYQKNSKRFWQINPKSLKDLRNNLIHFFSVNNDFSIWGEPQEDTEIETLLRQHNPRFLTTNWEEFFLWVSEGMKILIKKFIQDCSENPVNFAKKIEYVKEMVEKYWAKAVIKNN